MSVDLQQAAQVPAVLGTKSFIQALVIEGDNQGNAALKLTPVAQIGRIPRLYINAPGRTLTLADTTGGIISSVGAGQTALVLPNMTLDKTVAGTLYPNLGFVRNANNPLEISFLFQRTGAGTLFVNPVDASVVINWNGFDPQYLPIGHPPVMLTSMGSTGGVDTWFAH